MSDPFPPAPRKRGDPVTRLGWCVDNHHPECPRKVVGKYEEHLCECPCHDVAKKRTRSKPRQTS